MSRCLQLENAPTFKPLIKISKNKMKYVEDVWHHAVLSLYDFIPSCHHVIIDIMIWI